MANKKIYRWVALGALVLSLIAFCMYFVPTLSLEIDKVYKVNTLEITFGKDLISNTSGSLGFMFNAGGAASVLLWVASLVLSIIAVAKSNAKRALSIVAAALQLASASSIFMLIPNMTLVEVAANGEREAFALWKTDTIKALNVKLLSGYILYAVVAFLSCAGFVVSAILNKN